MRAPLQSNGLHGDGGSRKSTKLVLSRPFQVFHTYGLRPGDCHLRPLLVSCLVSQTQVSCPSSLYRNIYIREIVVARLNTVSFTLGKTHIYYAYEFWIKIKLNWTELNILRSAFTLVQATFSIYRAVHFVRQKISDLLQNSHTPKFPKLHTNQYLNCCYLADFGKWSPFLYE